MKTSILIAWVASCCLLHHDALAQRKLRKIVDETQSITIHVEKLRKKSNGESPDLSQTKVKKQVNYLLLLGVSQYAHWSPLNTPKKDAQDLKQILITKYGFDKGDVSELYDEQFTKANLIGKIDEINSLTRDFGEGHDNLIIFYSGHGYLGNHSQRGYWVPASAEANKVEAYIPIDKVKQYIKEFSNIKHIFVIADACFSGAFFTDDIAKDAAQTPTHPKSRWVLTSSDINKANDGKRGENSPFMKVLLKHLREYQGASLNIEHLIDQVKNEDHDKTGYKGRRLLGVGDEGGTFLLKNQQTSPPTNQADNRD